MRERSFARGAWFLKPSCCRKTGYFPSFWRMSCFILFGLASETRRGPGSRRSSFRKIRIEPQENWENLRRRRRSYLRTADPIRTRVSGAITFVKAFATPQRGCFRAYYRHRGKGWDSAGEGGGRFGSGPQSQITCGVELSSEAIHCLLR